MSALTAKEMSIVCLSAAVARGDQAVLERALDAGFAAELTLSEAKEIVGQLYAYCGFPRALNAAGTLMAYAAKRPALPEGTAPGPLPEGPAVVFGEANQTKLCGGPVKGALFDFIPQLDEYLKAHLFGDIFARDNISWRIREIATVAALAARHETEPQCRAHIAIAKSNGVTQEQIDAILAAVRAPSAPAGLPPDWSVFPVGAPNTAYAKYFIGNSYLAPVSTNQVGVFAVTFEPGCRNNWHIHHAKTGGGQILVCTAGRGFYQEWGKSATEMKKGDTVNIAPGVKHWHGASPDSWFQHLSIEVPGSEQSNEWLDPVDDAAYAAATK